MIKNKKIKRKYMKVVGPYSGHSGLAIPERVRMREGGMNIEIQQFGTFRNYVRNHFRNKVIPGQLSGPGMSNTYCHEDKGKIELSVYPNISRLTQAIPVKSGRTRGVRVHWK